MNRYFAVLVATGAKLSPRRFGLVTVLALVGLFSTSLPVSAHHAFGGRTPTTFVEGFLSGLAHPVIGLDHFAFIVAAGLVAAVTVRGMLLPVSFVLTSIAGTGLHLMAVNLPGTEFLIALSVLIFGLMLALKHRPRSWIGLGLAAIAGLCHGYAYGESISGAEMVPLAAYLTGFALIQTVIALIAYGLGRRVMNVSGQASGLSLRFAGFVICGVGATFLATLLVDTVFPV